MFVWEGLTNREIATIVGTSEQIIKNYLRSAFDTLGVWSRLEMAMYMANHSGMKPSPRPTAAIPWTIRDVATRARGADLVMKSRAPVDPARFYDPLGLQESFCP